MSQFVKFFNEIGIKDVPVVGGKNASLGEMYQKLSGAGIKVPNGFATTAKAYSQFIKKAQLDKRVKAILKDLDTKNISNLAKKGAEVRAEILASEISDDLKDEIISAYHKLGAFYKTANPDVAVRSSATAEDLPDASFAGQQETFLNIRGEKELLIAVKKCIASLFTDRAISYRQDKNFDHFDIALSVGVQKMVRSDVGSSGVMFTIDTESGFKDVVLINSIYGLGENIVQGKVNPDEFYIFKPTGAIIARSIGKKTIKMIYNSDPTRPVKDVKVNDADQRKASISDKDVLKLARWGMAIEKHYKRPMDIEWALDGKTNELFIIQARPETIHSTRDYNVIEEFEMQKRGRVIAKGKSVGYKVGVGKANRILSVKDIGKFRPGEVLVTEMTDPDWQPIMKIASAIVTDKGGRTCHAAIVSRELGIPCVVGTTNASRKIKSGQMVTVDCTQGEEGLIYDGKVDFKINKINIKKLPKPKVKIMMNIGTPKSAFGFSFFPSDGVGLAREEFIINDSIKIHPLALLNYDKIKDEAVKRKIDVLTFGYKDKKQFFIDKLAEGVALIGAAFYPKDVIVRLSDFKTNEYRNLIGGAEYEPEESNPMIGWRGASRYYDERFRPAFEMECAALKKVRDGMGLTNIKIMVPFCRTVEEGKRVIEIMAKNGLKQGKNGLEVYVMAEIPANIILAEEFAKVFDGFSIGSNDLTQLTLGIDRDSGGTLKVAGESSERNAAVKELIKSLIRVAKKAKRKVGICGQAPSDFPEFAKFLMDEGIDSISLNPDTVVKTIMKLGKK